MTTAPQLLCIERVDDLPVLWATLQRLDVPAALDRHFPTPPRWQGDLSVGDVLAVWLLFLLSQGDHRLNQLQPWAEERLLTLQTLLGKTVRALDFHDDRLAALLSTLPQGPAWTVLETELNQHTVRVYDLAATRFRLDTTTVHSYAEVDSAEGLLQFGHSKDHHHLPQLKVATTVLDPLGMPVCSLVVPGNQPDDRTYLPQIQQVQQAFGVGGKTYVGDCKMAALATRATLVSTADHYLCPLTEKQLPWPARLELLRAARQSPQPLTRVVRPRPSPEDVDELVAEGFAVEVALQAEVAGQTVAWTERRWVVRSVALAEGQAEKLERRLRQAQEALPRLTERQHGKRVLTAAELHERVQTLLERHGVEGLLAVTVQTTRRERPVRRYRGRPAYRKVQEEHQVSAVRQEEALAEAKAQLGWQVYSTNDLGLSLEAVVWGYRGQYQSEHGWARLKGRPLGLTPMYLAEEERMHGLVLLLSLALRVLTVLEWVIRRQLGERGEVLRGLYAGQAGRKTTSPSAELLLRAFRGISLSVMAVEGRPTGFVTPLKPIQEKLLGWWGLPAELYQRLTALNFPEPPPA